MPECPSRSWGQGIQLTLMTDTKEPKIITDALAIIDKGLSEMVHRELVSSDEVSDLLLDVRMLLTAAEMAAASGPLLEEPVGA